MLVSKTLISKVLREDFQMRYRKVKNTSFLGNFERNLALRCVYGQKFLCALEMGYTIINIDQSWIN